MRGSLDEVSQGAQAGAGAPKRCSTSLLGPTEDAGLARWRQRAALAQLVEHIIRNDGVACSIHVGGSIYGTLLPGTPIRTISSTYRRFSGVSGNLRNVKV